MLNCLLLLLLIVITLNNCIYSQQYHERQSQNESVFQQIERQTERQTERHAQTTRQLQRQRPTHTEKAHTEQDNVIQLVQPSERQRRQGQINGQQRQSKHVQLSQSDIQARLKAKILSIELLRSSVHHIRGLHSSVEYVYPTIIVANRDDVKSPQLPVIWDVFLKNSTICVVMSRYLDGFELDPESILGITIPTTQGHQHELRCLRDQTIDRKGVYGTNKTILSIDHPRICILRHAEIDNYLTAHSSIDVTVSLLGAKKHLNLKPIDQQWKSYSLEHNARLFAVTMVGDMPPISASQVQAWMMYHKQLGIQHFYLYYLYPVVHIPQADINTYNEIADRENISFTIIQWYKLYYPLPSIYPATRQRGCSHIGLIQSALYRSKWFSGNSFDATHRQPNRISSAKALIDWKIPKNNVRWMLESDIDDYLVPPHYENTLQQYLDSLSPKCAGATFSNSYFYLLTKSIADIIASQPSFVSWAQVDHKYMFPNNFSFQELKSLEVIRDTDLETYRHRQKIIYNTQLVLIGSAHQVDTIQNDFKPTLCGETGYYLHLLQSSLGRNATLMISPERTCFKKLAPQVFV